MIFNYRHLFKPLKLGNIELKNRIAFTSIGIDSYNEDGTVTDENISFVKARSQETALIISTVSMASYKYGKVKFIASYDDSFIPSLSRFAEAGHWGGAKMLLQISALGGPNTLADDVFHEIIPYVPSANIPDYTEQWKGKNVPRELSTQQVEEIADDFIKAAERAKKAGFDGVELFAAEDFLLASFITPHFNCRNDRYGGSFENRLRLPVEIIRGIRKLCGEDFIIGFKYNAFYEFPEGDGVDLGLGVKIGQRIADEKVSYLHAYSYAKHDIPFSLFRYSIMASQYQPRNNTLPVAEALKKNIRNVAVMAVGSILKPAEADRIISRGYADLVSVGRAFIADHLWAYKARHGIPIRPCVRCFVCLDEATKSRIIGCSVNPDVLVEAGNILKEAVSPKKIMVTGSGPAGIVFSLTAKKRGHNVVLYEKEKSTGGKLITNAVRNLKYEYMDLLLYWRNELKKSGVEVITNKNATPELVRKNRPDVLVLAIGARNKIPSVPGINNGNVLNVSDAILKASNIKGKSVVIFGGQDYGCEAALLFARSGNRVTVVEEKDRLMTENDIEYLTMVLERLMVQEDIR
ncbi:MAG: hypothetical protein FJW66_05060, partial [Actinobacteria bacterium]|nr:hypothetical protein [Actinomycetota bacterium]